MEDFDHYIVFVLLLALAIGPIWAAIRWGAKAANIPGLANLYGG